MSLRLGQINTYSLYCPLISEDESELKYRFEIVSFPTILLIKGDKYKTFSGNATLENLVNFVKGGYKHAASQQLKPAKGPFGKLVFIVTQNVESFVRTLDRLGLAAVPRKVKVAGVILFLFSPIIAVLLCMWITKEPAEEKTKAEDKKKTE